MAKVRSEREWADLDARYDVMKRQTGWDTTHMASQLGLSRQTLVDRLRLRIKQGTLPEDVNPWAGAAEGTPEVHQGTPEHQGTLEEYQAVMEEVHQSVPDVPYIATEGEHPSTPIVHPDVSPDDSTTVHPGVPARQDRLISTPMVYPGTPSEEDWELWTTIKARWREIEKMLADRQALRRTPLGTPGNTQKKTYVFDVRHVQLIDRYAQDHRLDLKDVLYQALEDFFQQRGYVAEQP